VVRTDTALLNVRIQRPVLVWPLVLAVVINVVRPVIAHLNVHKIMPGVQPDAVFALHRIKVQLWFLSPNFP
jgi:hypothetical protein